jgi:hypothetical protein
MHAPYLFALAIVSFSIIACSESGTKQKSDVNDDCEQFLVEYEKFADEYIAFMRKVKSNSSDISLLSQSATMMEKATKFGERADASSCADNSAAAARVAKIQGRVAAAIQ